MKGENTTFPKWLWVIVGVVAIGIYASQESKPVSSLSATNSEQVIVYTGPNVDSPIMGRMDTGTQVLVNGKNGDVWVTFRFNGKQGWIQRYYLDFEGNPSRLPDATHAPIPIPTQTPRVTASNINLHAECASMSNRVGEYVTCKIRNAYCSYQPTTNGSPTFCNDVPYPDQNFTLLVWGEDWSDYDGECILVSGIMSTYQSSLQIELTNRSQVSLCP